MMKERPSEAEHWIYASKFRNAQEARRCYEEARDLLLIDDLPASTFRFTLKDASYVAVLGDVPLSGVDFQRVAEVLSAGEPAGVPDELAEHLRERRQQFEELRIDFLEKRRAPQPNE